MPSRQAPSGGGEGGRIRDVVLAIVAGALVLLFLSFLVYVVRKVIYKRTATAPSEVKVSAPRRFKYYVLRRATASFSEANRLGKGGVGSVYGGVLEDGRSVAVKVIDSGSLQGEREFRNEILLAGRIGKSERVLSMLGFVEERRRKELVLVYELMRNGSLQDALLYRKRVELVDWKVRFRIALDIADGIYFLHFVCDPPVIHCDIKPSNVLLDCDFRAKLADFGLASVRCGKGYCQAVDLADGKIADEKIEDGDNKNGSFGEGSQFMESGVEDGAGCSGLDGSISPDCLYGDADLEMSLPLKVFGKQGSGDGTESGTVKVFPMERSRSEAVDASPTVGAENPGWGSYDEYDIHVNEKHQKLPREWWKEEFCSELTNKSQKKRGLMALGGGASVELCRQSDDDGATAAKNIRTNMTFINGWYHKLSFDILKKQRSNRDEAYEATPKSNCASSTPSMKGTVCYTAPEFSCAGHLSEKCDVYSFGVLLLVLISGRRPLEMTSTLKLDFERANLVSWARQLAPQDKLLDLVDPNIKSLDEEQALRCLTVALHCLQRSPANRPSAKELVQMLSYSSDPPHLPLEFSPSPPQITPR